MPSKSRLFSQLIASSGQIKAEKLSDDISTIEQVSSTDNLSSVGNVIGDQRVVGNTLYIWNGAGWYRIALINETPTWDSGGQPSGSYVLDADSPQDATIITLAASDPDGLPISYSYVTAGSMDSMATISQDSSVFTITPIAQDLSNAGQEFTGSITFRASDGVNILPSVSSFTLSFVTIIENSRYTTLLATATGTGDNNDITDASSSNHTITVTGDVHAGTFSPYRHGGYSTYFPDSGWGPYTDNVIAPSSDFAFGTGAFTVSFWYKFEHSFSSEIFDTRQTSVNMNGFRIWLGPSGGVNVYYATSTVLGASTTAAVGVWGHICVTRDGSGNLKIFLNGTQAASTTDNNNYTAQGLSIGNSNSGINDFRGWMKDIHVVKGYSYEPDTTSIYSPAQVGVGTVFLGCTTPTMQDVSTAARPISSLTAFTFTTDVPNDNNEYSAADHGGSVYFDGQGDYLTIPASDDFRQDQGDWTIDGWFYFKSFATATVILSLGSHQGIDNFTTYITNTGSVGYEAGNGTSWAALANYNSPNNLVSLNQWHHIAWVRSSGSLFIYLDGTRILNQASATFGVGTSGNLYIGNYFGQATSNAQPHYQSDLRIIKGTALYTGDSFSVPTAPLSSSGTSLHLKGTDASIMDKSQVSNLKLVGNTTGSTTQVKFTDTKSMYFDGTGDYALVTGVPDLGDDFTIEAWIYSTATGNAAIVGSVDNYGSFSGSGYWNFMRNAGNKLILYIDSGTYTQSTSTVPLNQWVHVACTRSSGTIYYYIDGTRDSTTVSNSLSLKNPSGVVVGSSPNNNYIYNFNGYIQDLRLTVGNVRYTAADESSNIPSAPLKG